MTARALLLTPSRGLGGGIERYVETPEWAFESQRIEYRRVDLQHAGAAAHVRLLTEARKQIRAIAPTRLVVAHRSLLPAAWLLAHGDAARGISVVYHGNDVWAARGRGRLSVENRLMRRPGVRIAAVSSFTAGALAGECRAAVLGPGLSQGWFDTLVKASAEAAARNAGPQTHLPTAFWLEQWRGKGLPEMLAAVDESATELAKVLEQLPRNPGQLAEIGRRAAAWMRQCFAPDRYALQAVARLL